MRLGCMKPILRVSTSKPRVAPSSSIAARPLPPKNHHRSLSSISPISSQGSYWDTRRVTRMLLRPALFTAAVCLGSFGAVAIWESQQQPLSTRSDEEAIEDIEDVGKKGARLPIIGSERHMSATMPIIFANTAVLCVYETSSLLRCWSPRMKRSFVRFFVHRPFTSRTFPLLTSGFAHANLEHLCGNSLGIAIFGPPAMDIMGGSREQFWAAYISALTMTSFGRICLDLIMAALRGFPVSKSAVGSSGAVYAMLCAVTMHGIHSEAVWSAPFLAFVTLTEMKGLVWRKSASIAHGAHVSGLMLGYATIAVGGLEMIQRYQAFVAKGYRDLQTGLLVGGEK